MNAAFDHARFISIPLIGIIRLPGKIDPVGLVDDVLEAGLTTLEVSFTHEDAHRQLEGIVAAAGTRLNVGAGTVTTMERLMQARTAGASFIVTPFLNPAVVSAAQASGLAVFPGAYTPTEIAAAQAMGATMVKIYPAVTLGPAFVAQLKATLPEIRLLPTGGIAYADIPAWKKAGADGLGLGGGLFPAQLLACGDWLALTAHMRKFVSAWHTSLG